MKSRMVHNNFNVLDLEKNLKFYADAFDKKEVRRVNAKDGGFTIAYIENCNSDPPTGTDVTPRLKGIL